MNRILTGQDMKKIDRNTIDYYGIPSLVLMERAALGVANEVMIREFINKEKVLIVCGTGNNGGDGLAVGRILLSNNVDVKMVIVGDYNQFSVETKKQYEILVKLNGPIVFYQEESFYHLVNEADVIVDAIFGVGLSRDIKGIYKEVIQTINGSKKYVIAIDIPSGIDANSGKVLGISIKANQTIALSAYKLGQVLFPGHEYCNEIKVIDIGIPLEAYKKIDKNIFTMSKLTQDMLPTRKPRSNKGSYGKVLVMAGSKNMSGAAYLSGLAAYRTGVGLVHIVTPEDNRIILQSQLPEAIITTYEFNNGCIEQNHMEKIKQAINNVDVIVIGPGLSTEIDAKTLLIETIKHGKVPLIIDADGLNIIAKNKDILKNHQQPIIVTPHPGEMSRLMNEPVQIILDQLIEKAMNMSEQHNVITVLKDSNTVITSPTRDIYINLSGNNGMATAGAGDVLSGVIGGLVAQGIETFKAAYTGVLIHGLAGDKAKESKGYYGMIARDIIQNIPEVMK
ncbi:NAD(P)H-hydrate epimerase [Natranaerovirga hydrolytica]|uniref:Bifunctional NAD(P)H-hydrate repair enzyme n=1 Tax=Natranaerovirga hydrolytica TaxID=680378 RepID=A0A4V2Q0A1_9FIRM|nr:NAD(P)H-hydrate dehydratase [Natranaerovirga hydrolytica]TCK92881.1 NAD(P)H-hydrate epimerase [Natranaerovirga hydrolytica]